MARSLALVPLLALMACPDTKNTDDTAVVSECDVEIDETIPASDAVDHYYLSNIEFYLSDPDSTATVVTDIPGTTTMSEDEETIIFTPDSLSPSTDYTVSLEYCRGTAELNFRTSDLGAGVDPSALLGLTYSIDLGAARILEPEGVGAVLTSQLQQDILVGVQTASDTSIQMLGAIAVEGGSTQDYCTPTIPFPAAEFDSSNGYFQIGPQTTTLTVAGYAVEIEDLAINGTFAADGSYFGGGELSGTIDTRPLAPLIDDSGDPNAICDLAANFGATCETCPSDGELYCLTLVADQITAVGVADVELVEVEGNDCEGCESGPPAEDAVCDEGTTTTTG